jgi:purine-binding chemotaxis protein CheW
MTERAGPAPKPARPKLGAFATEETFLNAYTRRRAGDAYDRELITFLIGTEIYALDIKSMREIIKLRPITEVPRTPAFVRGIVTVRGEVIPALDLRLRLGMPELPLTRSSRILVCNLDDEPHGLIVDGVRQVVRFSDSEIEPPPPIGNPAEGDFLAGIGRSDGELVILLDLRAVVTFSLDSTR